MRNRLFVVSTAVWFILLVVFVAMAHAVEFKPYKDNYVGFLWVNPQSDGSPSGAVSYEPQQAKFQVSFATNLVELPNLWTHVWLGYTQKSFWDIFDESSPFAEHDFNPELFFSWSPDVWKLDSWQGGWEHESNGVGGDESRSWDRAYVAGTFKVSWLGFEITGFPKVWYVLDTGGENLDIGETDITGVVWDDFGASIRAWVSYKDMLILDGEFWSHEGTVQVRFQDDAWANYYGFVQAYRGKGDSLIDYDEYTTTALAGISLGK